MVIKARLGWDGEGKLWRAAGVAGVAAGGARGRLTRHQPLAQEQKRWAVAPVQNCSVVFVQNLSDCSLKMDEFASFEWEHDVTSNGQKINEVSSILNLCLCLRYRLQIRIVLFYQFQWRILTNMFLHLTLHKQKMWKLHMRYDGWERGKFLLCLFFPFVPARPPAPCLLPPPLEPGSNL